MGEQVPHGRARRAGRLVEVEDALLRRDEHGEGRHGLGDGREANDTGRVPAADDATLRIDDPGGGEGDRPAVDLAKGLHECAILVLLERRNIPGTGAYEPIVGYSRAVVAGDRVHVSGTAANPPDGSPPPEDVYDQTHVCLELIRTALEKAGTSLEHVVRTRVYLVDPADFDGFARAHAEVFGDVRPANTTVLAGLFDPRWKVEIEVEAILP